MVHGYYEEFQKLKQETEEADWGFLENEYIGYGLTTYSYLHGFCHDFALYLHELYGYPIECIYNEAGNLIHAYCVVKSTQLYFVDVRGITDNWDIFIQEFMDWIPCLNGIPEYPLPNTIRHEEFTERASDPLYLEYGRKAAKKIVDDNPAYYNVGKI